ncbi:MAG: hypothetical protein M1358_14280 [Chloroflexi bacterium]|nr:hypothetical protein [Chloroflexota bacterium]
MDENREETVERESVWASSMPHHSLRWVFQNIVDEVVTRMGGWEPGDTARYGELNAEEIKKLEAIEVAGFAGAVIVDLMRQKPFATYEEIAQEAVKAISQLQQAAEREVEREVARNTGERR